MLSSEHISIFKEETRTEAHHSTSATAPQRECNAAHFRAQMLAQQFVLVKDRVGQKKAETQETGCNTPEQKPGAN